MRIVISGGSGLIGSRLTAERVEAGDEVVVLSRRPERVAAGLSGAAVEKWDGEDASALAALLEGTDAVVHLAGENIGAGRWTAERKRRIEESRVRSSRAVAEAIGRCEGKPRVLLQASAVGYYGARGDEILDESAPPGEDFLGTVCRRWEDASAGVEAMGVRRAVLRTGIVLSTEGGALPRMALPFKLFAGGPAGSGEQWMPWIHLADETGAIAFLLADDRASGPFNLTAPEPVTNRAFGRALGRVLRRPSFLPAPAFALRLALGEMATLVLDGQRAVPRNLEALSFPFRFRDAEAALRDLLG